MFKEKLHNDIDRITPSAELLDRVSLMMKEEASRKKPKIYMTAVKYGSLAAAVCLITAVAVMLSNTAGDNAIQTKELARSSEETVSDVNMMSYKAETFDEADAGGAILPMATEAQMTEAAAEAEVGVAAMPMAIENESYDASYAADEGADGVITGGAGAEEYGFCETTAVSEGFILPCENGSYLLISENMGAVVLNPDNNDSSIFDGLTAGDVVRVNRGYILESYPSQTTLYDIEKITDGELSDIPEDTLKQLEELGWLPLTEN